MGRSVCLKYLLHKSVLSIFSPTHLLPPLFQSPIFSSSSGFNPNLSGVAGANFLPPLTSVKSIIFTCFSLFYIFVYTVFPSSSWPTYLLSSSLHSSYPHIIPPCYMSPPAQSSSLHPFCDVSYFHNPSYFLIPSLSFLVYLRSILTFLSLLLLSFSPAPRDRSRAGLWGAIWFILLSFSYKKFLNTIVCYIEYHHFGGTYAPSPLDPPLHVPLQ